MKQLLLTTIAAVVLMGCGPSVDIHQAAHNGNIEAVKQHLAAGVDVNVRLRFGQTPLDWVINYKKTEIAAVTRFCQPRPLRFVRRVAEKPFPCI